MASTISKNAYGVSTSKNCINGGEMLTACGGDFDIEKRQVYYQSPIANSFGSVDSDGQIIPEMQWQDINLFVPVRSDTGHHIADATVGDGYNIVQNSEVIEIVDAICGSHNLNYNFMTLLKGGRGLAVQVECPDLSSALNVGDDQNRGRMTISNFHDGTGTLKVHMSLLRLFCSNVLPALNREFRTVRKSQRTAAYSIRHSSMIPERIAAMVATYQEAMEDMVSTADLLRSLASHQCSWQARKAFFKSLVNKDGKDERELTSRARKIRETKLHQVQKSFHNPLNKVADASGSWYEVLQAATWIGSHEANGRVDNHWEHAEMGGGAQYSSEALQLALEMSDIA